MILGDLTLPALLPTDEFVAGWCLAWTACCLPVPLTGCIQVSDRRLVQWRTREETRRPHFASTPLGRVLSSGCGHSEASKKCSDLFDDKGSGIRDIAGRLRGIPFAGRPA